MATVCPIIARPAAQAPSPFAERAELMLLERQLKQLYDNEPGWCPLFMQRAAERLVGPRIDALIGKGSERTASLMRDAEWELAGLMNVGDDENDPDDRHTVECALEEAWNSTRIALRDLGQAQ